MIPLTRSFKTGGGTGSAVDLDEEKLNPKSVAVDDPIVGESMETLDEHGPGAIEPKVMSVPKELTPHQKARHVISHLPYDPSCEICVACRRPNDPHSLSHESSRTIPLLVGDFGYMRDSKDDDNATILVLKLYPFRLNFACVVASKGRRAVPKDLPGVVGAGPKELPSSVKDPRGQVPLKVPYSRAVFPAGRVKTRV